MLQRQPVPLVEQGLHDLNGSVLFLWPYQSAFNMICAGVLITLLPAQMILILFQKQARAGLASGFVKG